MKSLFLSIIIALITTSLNAQVVTQNQLEKTAWFTVGIPSLQTNDTCIFYRAGVQENKNKLKIIRSDLFLGSLNRCSFVGHQVCTALFTGRNRSWAFHNDIIQIINPDGIDYLRFKVIEFTPSKMVVISLK
jgi:hypothetical protein